MHDTILLMPCAFGLRRRDDSEIPCKTRFSWVYTPLGLQTLDSFTSLSPCHMVQTSTGSVLSLPRFTGIFVKMWDITRPVFAHIWVALTVWNTTQPREASSFEFQITFAAFSDVAFPLASFRIHQICLGHWNTSELLILERYEYKTIIFVWDILIPQSQKLLYKAEMAFQTASATKKWMSNQVIV